MTQLGVYRRLQTLSTDGGHFNILAVDHRDALRVAINSSDPGSVPDQTLVTIKTKLVAHLAHLASAVMLEPEYSMAQTIAGAVLPPDRGFTAAIEAQGYLADSAIVTNDTLSGWSVDQAAAAGASAAKILVLWDPAETASQVAQMRWIEGIAADCSRNGLPLLLEPIIRSQVALDRHLVMIERMASLGPTILKLAISPGEDRFDLLDEAAAGIPWVLLSAGVGYEVFAEQVAGACQSGASGFAVGRALWGDYLRATDANEEEAEAVMVARLRSLCDTTARLARPWTTLVSPPQVSPTWFTE